MFEDDRRVRERIVEFEVRRLELRQRRARQEAGRRRALDVPRSSGDRPAPLAGYAREKG